MSRWIIFACMLCAAPPPLSAHAQTITKASVSFHTTSDDKDGDTQIRDRITCNGRDFFKLDCCSAGKHSPDDHFDNGSDRTRDMTLISPLAKSDLGSCTFVAGSSANGGAGNDNWVAIYTLTLSLSDGTRMAYTLGEIGLNSVHHSFATKAIQLAKLSPTFP
jgi:hypothetical protein